jgi:hypothetical protein
LHLDFHLDISVHIQSSDCTFCFRKESVRERLIIFYVAFILHFPSRLMQSEFEHMQASTGCKQEDSTSAELMLCLSFLQYNKGHCCTHTVTLHPLRLWSEMSCNQQNALTWIKITKLASSFTLRKNHGLRMEKIAWRN